MVDGVGRLDERDAVQAAQRGGADAARALVAAHEREMLRTAFLLTDDQQEALRLVGRTWELAFGELRRLDPESPLRPWLFQRLARTLLSPTHEDGDRPPGVISAFDGGPSRYRVDDERRRLRAALLTLEAPERLALVLHEFNGFDAEIIASGISQPPGEVTGHVRAARRQLANRVDLPDGQSVGVVLTEAALEAPRVQVWPVVEDRVIDIQEDELRRARRLTGGVVGGVSLLAVTVLSLLIYGAISGDETAGGAGAAATATGGSAAAMTATPIIVDSPAQTPRESGPVYEPNGDVPDLLLRVREGSSSAADRHLLQRLDGGARILLPPGDPLTISPDGRTLMLVNEQPGERGNDWILIAADTRSGEERWRVHLEGGLTWQGYEPVINAAIVNGQVVVAAHDPSFRTDLVMVARYTLESGEELGLSEMDLNQNFPNVFVFPRPAQEQIILVAESRGGDGVSFLRVDVGGEETSFAQVREYSGVEFDFSRAKLTPSGNGLYAIESAEGDGGAPAPVVRFVSFSSFAASSLALPFRSATDAGALATTISHDGHWLYAVSPIDRQVAIVDLQRRQVERLAELDAPDLPPDNPELELAASPDLFSGRSAALSLDGRYLYVSGAPREVGDAVGMSVWRIEIETWTVVDQWLPNHPDRIHALYVGADDGVLAVQSERSDDDMGNTSRYGTLQMLDSETGEIVGSPDVGRESFELLGSLADHYRDTFGNSPSVDSRAPEVVDEYTSLPLTMLEVGVERVVPGEAIRVTLRFLDPRVVQSIREVVPGISSVRFDPSADVTLIITDGGRRHLITLGEEEYGVYSATLRIDDPGSWDALVSITSPEGSWSVAFEGALHVRRTFQSLDGHSYYLEISSVSPSLPRAGNPIGISARFVDTESGDDMPDGASIEGGLPETLEAVTDAGASGALFHSGDGRYTGIVTFVEPGSNMLRLTWTDTDGVEQFVEIGPVRVQG